MYVLGNPILGKNFRRSSLILNEEGLHRLVRVDLGRKGIKEERFFLTNDVNKILELMDLKLSDFDGRTKEDIYVNLIVNKYFFLEKFYGVEEEKCRELEELRNFLNTFEMDENHKDQIDKLERLVIRTTRVEEVLGIEIRNKVDEIKFLIENFEGNYKTKFDTMKVLLIKSGYVPQNFSKDLPKFKGSTGNKLETMAFYINKTPEEIFEHYKKVTG